MDTLWFLHDKNLTSNGKRSLKNLISVRLEPGSFALYLLSTIFQLKIKEAFHIQREQPSLNQQLHHVNLKLSL